MFWTDERKALLVRLHETDQMTFKRIRELPEFRGCTKNALIGQFDRLRKRKELEAVKPFPPFFKQNDHRHNSYASIETRHALALKALELAAAPRLSSLISSSSICAKEGCGNGKQPATPYCASHSREHIEMTQQPHYKNHGKVEL